MSFRPELQGLRGVAILLVVLGHAGVPGVSGGFIGVDVFFVLSGYLITSMLWSEIQQSGRISYGAFYYRRLKRLLPALLFMVSVSAVLMYLIMEPFQQGLGFISAITALLWSSNIHYALQSRDYFSPKLDDPFLHTWSLGIEEQFYLLWPLILGLTAWWAMRSRAPQRTPLWVFLVLTATSAGLAWWWTDHNAVSAYYLPFTRFWQFSSGAILALPLLAGWRPLPSTLTGSAGMLLVAIAAVGLDEQWAYPGLIAWLPTTGTLLLILAVSQSDAGPITRLMSCRPLVWVGDRSYSWYLWHWPALVLAWAVWPGLPLWGAMLVLAGALLMASISLRWVENPMRFGALSQRQRPYVMLSLAMLAAVIGLQVLLHERSYQHSQLPEFEQARAIPWDQPELYLKDCDQDVRSDQVLACEFGAEHPDKTLVVLGDSVAAQWTPALLPLEDAGWQIIVITKANCPMVDEMHFSSLIGRIADVCARWRQNARAWLADKQPDLIVTSSHDDYPFTLQQWREGSERLLAEMATVAGRVVVMRSTPTLPFDPSNCTGNRIWQQRIWGQPLSQCRATVRSSESEAVYAALSTVVASLDNVSLVDFNDEVCPQNDCEAVVDGGFVFRDRLHLTRSYVLRMGEQVRAAVLGVAGGQHETDGENETNEEDGDGVYDREEETPSQP